jgi:EmrB/QacA subfamily drug resistance transporter
VKIVASSAPEAVHRRRWVILGVLVICLLVVILDNTILNVALKTIQQDLGASQSSMEWAVNAYVLVFAGLLFTWWVAGDRFGRKRVLLIGLLLFGAFSAACAFSGSPAALIATRGLMGIGGAAVQPQTLSIISNVFDPEERPKAIGIWAGFSGVALAIGPLTGGFLLDHCWWGSVFLVNVPFVVVGVLAIAVVVPESRDPQPRRVDVAGVALSIVSLVLLVYGIIKGGETNDWTSPEVWGTSLAGVLLLGLFVLVEARSTHPALDVALFRKPQFAASTGAIGLSFFALMGASFFLSFYLQAVRGYSALQTGLCLLALAVGQIIAAPRSTALAERLGTRNVVAAGMATVAVCFAFFTQVDATTPVALQEVLLLFMGLGMGNIMAPATNAVMAAVPREQAGSGAAVNNTIRQVGAALGVAVLGSILSASYRARLGDAVQALPSPARNSDASESIGGTLEALSRTVHGVAQGEFPRQVLAAVPQVHDAAVSAFVHAMHVTVIGAVVADVIGALVVFKFVPAALRPGLRRAAPIRPRRDDGAASGPARRGRRGRPMSPTRAAPAPDVDDGGTGRRGPGRPRSRQVDEAIFDAAVELLHRHGFGGTSIEGVARRAGVAKTTIYRRWPTKEDLVLDVMIRLRGPAIPIPPGRSVRDDLLFVVAGAVEHHRDPAKGSVLMRRLLPEIDTYPDLARDYVVRVIGPRRRRLLEVLRRGVDQGVIRPDADLDLAAEALIAPVLIGAWIPFGPRLRPAQVPALVDLVLLGLSPRPGANDGG